MIESDEARRAFRMALDTFACPWTIVSDLLEVTIRTPDHWLSGSGTFGATLRDPFTGALKVLGRRRGPDPRATFHRGISGLVLEAYLCGNTDPIRRYLEEIGVIDAWPAAAAPPRAGALCGSDHR